MDIMDMFTIPVKPTLKSGRPRCQATNDDLRQCRLALDHEGEHREAPKGAPLRNIRVPDPLWKDAGRIARELGYRSLSAYLVDALRMLVEDEAIPWDLREA